MEAILANATDIERWLDTMLAVAPDEARFAQIANVFVKHPDDVLFLGVLARYENTPEGYLEAQSWQDLAETLLLYETRLRVSVTATVSEAYLHYVVNTSAPIPVGTQEDDFDVFAYAQRYAGLFNITLEEGTDPRTGKPATLMTIDDPNEPIVCAEWGAIAGKSSAESLRAVAAEINKSRYGRNDVIASTFFPYDVNQDAYQSALAMRLADMSDLAYNNPEYIAEETARLGFLETVFINNDNTDTQLFITRNADAVVVCFRGSQQRADWLGNLKVRLIAFQPPTPINPTQKTGSLWRQILQILAWIFSLIIRRPSEMGMVHRGFWAAHDSVWREVYEQVQDWRKGRKLYITGHSLGGVLAKLNGFVFESVGESVDGVYVYGAPRVGNQAFATRYNAQLGDKTFLHINGGDLVPKLPPTWLFYQHVATHNIRYFADDSHHVTVGSATAQFEENPELPGDDTPDTEIEKQIALEVLQERTRETLYYSNLHRERRFIIDEQLEDVSYSMEEESGIRADHSISEYMFKLACGLIDVLFDTLNIERKS